MTPGPTLNPEQEAARVAIVDFLESDSQYFGLFGYAGTGKTTVIQTVFDGLTKSIAMSAPTHKAVGVLASMADERGLTRVQFATIHSLLSCRKQRIAGDIVFRPDPRKSPPIHDYDIVVIDECSMVSEEMWGWITEAVDGLGIKIIVMGDPLQLPPVGDDNPSPTFDLPHASLQRIMRSRGVVQDAGTEVRLNIGSVVPPVAHDADDVDGEVRNLVAEEWLTSWKDAADAEQSNKALAFTNAAVDWLNEWMRKQLFGENAPPFVAGERLVMIETHEIQGRRQAMLHTEDELKVLEASLTSALGLECWKLDVESPLGKVTILVFDESQQAAYDEKLRAARTKGKALNVWGEYYSLKESFARVRPGWATTIHKSQGSTYDDVYLVQTNVLSAGRRDHAFRNMLLYVGYSRARRGLYLS